jgi:4-hydroxybenzoate polyprenyltransferase
LILVPAWSFYALGAHSGPEPVLATVLAEAGLWCLTAVLACAYVLNQIFDRESDAINGKGLHLTLGVFSVRTMTAIAVLCFAAASLLFRRVTVPQQLPLIFAFLLSLIYSLPPIRLCARPYFDLAANAIGYGGLAFVIGATGAGATFAEAWRDGVPWGFMVAATLLHTTMLDVVGDAAAGTRTISVAIGIRASAWVAVLFGFGAAADAAWSFVERGTGAGPVLVAATGFAGFVAAALWVERGLRRSEAERRAAVARASSLSVQLMTVLIAVVAVMRDPLLLLLLLPVIVAARAYYRARFGIVYPG